MKELIWLKQYLEFEDLSLDKIENILYFNLIWNILEKKINHSVKISKSKCIADEVAKHIDIKVVDDVWDYYYARYIRENKVNGLFTSFHFNTSDNKKFVENTMIKNNQATLEEKIETLMIITTRLRHNLYHGYKSIKELSKQNENFKYSNKLLMEILNHLDKYKTYPF